MEHLILPLLVMTVLGLLLVLMLQIASWFMHHALANRVAKLEAQQENTMTHAEVIQVYERLSSLEALAETQASSLKTIEKYLMEKDS